MQNGYIVPNNIMLGIDAGTFTPTTNIAIGDHSFPNTCSFRYSSIYLDAGEEIRMNCRQLIMVENGKDVVQELKDQNTEMKTEIIRLNNKIGEMYDEFAHMRNYFVLMSEKK